MESQKATRGSEKPAPGRVEQNTVEQPVSEYDTFSGTMVASKLSGASAPPPGQSPNTLQRRPEIATMSTRQLLHLQRTIGNQATRRLLRKEESPAAPTPVTTAPAGSIQRGWFDSPTEKAQKAQAKKDVWGTLLDGYLAANQVKWQTDIKALVKTETEAKMKAKLLALQTSVSLKASSKIDNEVTAQLVDLNNNLAAAATEQAKRKVQWQIDRANAHKTQAKSKVDTQLAQNFAGLVDTRLNTLSTEVAVDTAFAQAEFIKTALDDFIKAQDKNTPQSAKDFDKAVKKHMQTKTTVAQNNAWVTIEPLMAGKLDDYAREMADSIHTPVKDNETSQNTKKDSWNDKLLAIDTAKNTEWTPGLKTSGTTRLNKYLTDNLGTSARKQLVVDELKKGIDAKITELQGLITGTDERSKLEKESIKTRFAVSAQTLFDQNKALYDAIVTETIAKMMEEAEVIAILKPDEYVAKAIRDLLNPYHDQTGDFEEVRPKIKKKTDALKVKLEKDWPDEVQKKIKARLKEKADAITATFTTQVTGAPPVGGRKATATTGGDAVGALNTADQNAKANQTEDDLTALITGEVRPLIEKYMAERLGANGMGWRDFRSDKALEFRKKMKDIGRQKAYEEIEAQKTTHAKTSSMSTTGQDYIANVAKNHAYKHAKKSVNSAMTELAKAEATTVLTENDGLVRFELDIGWRDGVKPLQASGATPAPTAIELKNAGIAGAKKRVPALAKKVNEKALTHSETVMSNVVGTSSTHDDKRTSMKTGVEKQVKTDRVANRSITEAYTSDSVTQGYNKLANLINFMVPTPGDEVKIEVQIRVPGPDGLSFFLFGISGKAGRETAEEVKVSTSVSVGGGLQFWGGEATFKVGYFVEANAESANKIGMLMSYGTYRQMASGGINGPLTRLAEYLWGGRGIKHKKSTTFEDDRKFAEMWAAMVEETAMQRSYEAGTTPPTVEAKDATSTAAAVEGDDVFLEKEGQNKVTKEFAHNSEGREYLGKLTRIAKTEPSITVGDFSFTYAEAGGPGVQAKKSATSGAITKGAIVYAEDWAADQLTLTTKASETTPVAKDNHKIGKVKELSPGGNRYYTSGKSGNYVDVGYLVEAAGKVNFNVGKAEGVASYKKLSRYSKSIIDKMAAGKFGKSGDKAFYDEKRTQLGLNDKLGGGQSRHVLELEGKTEFGVLSAKMGFGLAGKFLWTGATGADAGGFEEVEIAGSAALPAEFLDENMMKTNMITSRIIGSFASGAKTLVSRALEQKKKNQNSTEDKTGQGGKELGTLTDLSADLFFPSDELHGSGLGAKMTEAGGKLAATRKDGVNFTVEKMFNDKAVDTPLQDTVNKFAMKNELAFTIKWNREHGRNKFSIDIKQTKGGEVNLGVFLAKVEKSKEVAKVVVGQEDKSYMMVTGANRPADTEKGKPVYFKKTGAGLGLEAGKITKEATDNEKAGVLVSVSGNIAVVRSWAKGLNILGFEF